MKNSDILRWILLVPLTLGGAFLVWVIGLGVFSNAMMADNFHLIRIYMVGILASASTAFTWLYLSYAIAPAHKSKVVCVSYVAGVVTMFLIFNHYIIRGFNGDISPAFIIICSGVVAGLGFAIYLFRKPDV